MAVRITISYGTPCVPLFEALRARVAERLDITGEPLRAFSLHISDIRDDLDMSTPDDLVDF